MPTVSANATPGRLASIAAVVAAVAIGLLLIFPRTSPGVLVALAALSVVVAGHPPKIEKLRMPPLPVVVIMALGVWATVSSLWAADRGEAIGKGALLLALTAAVWWTYAGLASADRGLLRHVGVTILVAFGACLAFLALEEATGHAFKRFVFQVLPFTRPSARHVAGTANELTINAYLTNRNMAAVMLGLWPMLLMVRALVDRRWRVGAAAALAVLATVTFAVSAHETSSIAFAASVLVFAIGVRWPKFALGLVAAGWLVVSLLIVPLATWAATSAKLDSATWLPNSARHRIVIWEYTAQHYWQRPISGIGVASTRVLDNRRGVNVEVKPGTHYQWRSGTHAHNIFLQTWYELGAVGALLLCGGGLAMVWASSKLPRDVVAYAAAAMTAGAAMGATSWGMWQAWFMAAFAISAVLLGFSLRLAASGDAPGSREISPDLVPSS